MIIYEQYYELNYSWMVFRHENESNKYRRAEFYIQNSRIYRARKSDQKVLFWDLHDPESIQKLTKYLR